MHQRGWKQSDLAREIGVVQTTISGYCRGSRFPPAEELLWMSRVFGVSVEVLLTGAADLPISTATPTIAEDAPPENPRRLKSELESMRQRAEHAERELARIRDLLRRALANYPEGIE